jgi:tetratricopeptide (TPR) repeat protein
MTRLLRALALAALILLSLDARLAGVRADDGIDCDKGSGDTQIRGCSRIIKSGRLYGKPISRERLASAYNNRGTAFEKKGQYDRAIANFDTAISLNPKHTNAYFNRGNAYEEKGQYDRAIANYDTAISLNPKDADAYFNRGNAYADKGQITRAIADYTQAILLNPKHTDAYYNRGVTYGMKGDYDRAIADFRKILELRPGDPSSSAILKRLGVTP